MLAHKYLYIVHFFSTLQHRHTHRVVRGSLLLCGRPDGRLSALTSLETSVCLSINQASSIQSIGGTWKVRVSTVLSCECLCSICSLGNSATLFDLHLPLFNCLCKSHVLMQVSIISHSPHKS